MDFAIGNLQHRRRVERITGNFTSAKDKVIMKTNTIRDGYYVIWEKDRNRTGCGYWKRIGKVKPAKGQIDE